jgi:redox-sensing transcriptional repressor
MGLPRYLVKLREQLHQDWEVLMNPLAIPDIVIRRMPLYLRTLKLLKDQGQTVTSSQEIGDMLGISATQIRKDLSYFGEFGKQGTGYDVRYLQEQVRQILKVDHSWNIALIGAGDLGRAILRYSGFEEGGFSIVAILDRDKRKIGRQIGTLEVLDIAQLPEVINGYRIQIAIIAVPTSDAQEVADALADAGVKAILSYAPIPLSLPADVRIEHIDPVVGLQSMTYYLDPRQR